jgi:hypothetical protein
MGVLSPYPTSTLKDYSLLIACDCSYPQHLEVISFICNLMTHHAVMTTDPQNMMEVTGDRRKFLVEVLHNLNVVKIMGETHHLACMGKRSHRKFLSGNLRGQDILGDTGIYERTILTFIIQMQSARGRLGDFISIYFLSSQCNEKVCIF